MFKWKVYLYKNINGKEEKIEKNFNDEKEFNDYIASNPELKKLENQWKEIKFPDTFKEVRKMFDDFDLRLFWEDKDKKWFFNELSEDFKKLSNKAKKLIWK
jgi:hypothetical protein